MNEDPNSHGAKKEMFTPPFPKPFKIKLGAVARLIIGAGSWIHTLYEKSYTMILGEIKLPGIGYFIANDPDLIDHILKKKPEDFPKHRFLEDMLRPLIGQSMFATNGAVWEAQRKMVAPSYAHTQSARSFDLMQDATLDLCHAIDALAKTGQERVSIDPFMTHITADIICRTMLSKPMTLEQSLDLFDAAAKYQSQSQCYLILRFHSVPGAGFWYNRAKKTAKRIHTIFKPDVEKRYNKLKENDFQLVEDPQDILDSLLNARHPETGDPFDVQDLLDQISLIFLAGHETSASALSWTLYLIASCPHLQERLHIEIDTVFGDANTLNLNSLKDMHHLRNTFSESLRLYPPISFFMREVARAMKIRNKEMNPGDIITVSPWLIQRNEKYWPCPHSFDPDRFDDPEQAQAQKCAYMPFGKGPRICLGKGFAQQEAMIVLAHILRRFEITIPKGEKAPEPVNRLTTRPKKAIRLHFKPRNLSEGKS